MYITVNATYFVTVMDGTVTLFYEWQFMSGPQAKAAGPAGCVRHVACENKPLYTGIIYRRNIQAKEKGERSMKALLVLLFIMLFLFLCYMVLIIPRFHKPDYRALLHHYYAHRGLHDIAAGIPENSMKAFQRAIDNGFGMEMDVQLSRDGCPVVFHDATLTRMCGVEKRVDALTLKELKELTLAGTQERIPTFQEFLDLVKGQVPLIIEIKMDKRDDRIPEAVNHLLTDYKGVYCIESFHPSALIWYKKNRPDVFRGQLCTNFNKENKNCSLPFFLLSKMLSNIAARPDFIAYNWIYRNDFSRKICCNLYRALPVGWTLRSQEEMDLCRKDFTLFIFENFIPKGDA